MRDIPVGTPVWKELSSAEFDLTTPDQPPVSTNLMQDIAPGYLRRQVQVQQNHSLPAQVEAGSPVEIQADPVNFLRGLLDKNCLPVLYGFLRHSGQPEPQLAFHAAAQIGCLNL